MIHEVDASLRALIDDAISDGDVEITFDAPTKEWASRQNSPAIDVFLYDIREDLTRRNVGPTIIRDDDGVIVERRAPPRRFKLSYLLTAWTQRAEEEHRFLAQLMTLFTSHDKIPADHLSGTLAELDIPVVLTVALPPSQDRSLSDIWTALGGELKPSLDLQVVAPLEPARFFEVGPATLEEPRITLEQADGSMRRIRRAPVEPLADHPDEPPPWEPDEGVASEDARREGERVQVGTDETPGRTFHVRQVPRRRGGP